MLAALVFTFLLVVNQILISMEDSKFPITSDERLQVALAWHNLHGINIKYTVFAGNFQQSTAEDAATFLMGLCKGMPLALGFHTSMV